MTTKTASIGAWLPSRHQYRPTDLLNADAVDMLNALGFSSHDMSTHGWVKVGDAHISVDLLPAEQCAADTIAALRREQGELQAKATQIEGEIQKLLAITYAPSRGAKEVTL